MLSYINSLYQFTHIFKEISMIIKEFLKKIILFE